MAVRRPVSPNQLEVETEREYGAHHEPVVKMLVTNFPRLRDPEEIYQEAWAELLAIRARGEEVRNPRSLLKKLAWRRAHDEFRRAGAVADSDAVEAAPDLDQSIEAEVELHLESDVLHQVIESLDAREAAVLKMKFDLQLTGEEMMGRLGVSRRQLEKLMTRAYTKVLEQVKPDATGTTQWTRRQRSLLMACELGMATAQQRAWAKDLVDRDPTCRAMLRSMRATLRDVAVALPMPPVVLEAQHRRGPIDALLDWSERALGVVRHPAPDLAAGNAASVASEHASATLAGGLGVAGAVKVAAACLAVGGAGVVCVTELSKPRPEPRKPPAVRADKPPRKPQPVAPVQVPVVARATTQPTTGKVVRRTRTQVVARVKKRVLAERRAEAQVASSPTYQAPATPAPKYATEFGVGATGSQPVAPQPAPAPANGGGEFGP